jgi:hypothetical protein
MHIARSGKALCRLIASEYSIDITTNGQYDLHFNLAVQYRQLSMLAGVRAELQHVGRFKKGKSLVLRKVGDFKGLNRKWISYLGRVPADLLAKAASVSAVT